MRGKFAAKTEGYKSGFEENDVDGKVLLNLDDAKLEKLGVKSLGHREYLLEEIVNLRSHAGMLHGPRPGEFEAAMRAQNAPPRHPPKLVSTTARAPEEREVKVGEDPFSNHNWNKIEKTAWNQEDREVEYFVFLPGVGGVAKEDLSVSIGEQSLEVPPPLLHSFHDCPLSFVSFDSFWVLGAYRPCPACPAQARDGASRRAPPPPRVTNDRWRGTCRCVL